MPLIIAFASAVALSFAASAGPAPRDASTNKPTAEACAAARAANRNLPGCNEAQGRATPARDDQDTRGGQGGERSGFLVCPGDARCPR
jgi:hypothetical protein